MVAPLALALTLTGPAASAPTLPREEAHDKGARGHGSGAAGIRWASRSSG